MPPSLAGESRGQGLSGRWNSCLPQNRLRMSTASGSLSQSSLNTLRQWGGFLFFLSGLTGLVYEILWTRRLNLTFGHSILAVSTVVTAYMGGLALGSALGGRWGDRRLAQGERASWFLACYGKLEGLVGLWAFASLPLLGAVERFYLEASGRGMEGLPLYVMAFLASLLVLLPPTTAMGATLPIVSCLYSSDPKGLGRILARLYSTNTFGAVCGVALAGFVLLPKFGLSLSVILAALLNLTIAALAVGISTRLQGHLEKAVAEEASSGSGEGRGNLLLPIGFALTGGLSMAAQMAWTRSLCLSLGSSVYAFSVILLVFLSGIALGSACYGFFLRNRSPQWHHVGLLSAGVGLSGALAIPVLGQLPLLFVHFFPLVKASYWRVLLLDSCLCFVVLIVPTVLMGLAFPLVTQLYHHQSRQLGRSVGNIYSANTLGCIVGSFLTGFVLIPQIGVQTTLEAAACGSLFLGALYLSQDARTSWRRVGGICLLLGLSVFTLPAWDPSVTTAGVATHGAMLRGEHAKLLPHRPLYYRDGLSGTVSVLLWDVGGLTLRVNGKPEASYAIPDRINQTVLGLLPYFYVEHPKRVGVIGLGSGLTLAAMAHCPEVEIAECAELEPYVIDAERFWRPYNDNICSDPRIRSRYADGRTMIMGASQKYDTLVSVPSNPWVAGVGNLYTQDFYASVRSKLNEGGVFVQWVNLYSLSSSDLQTVIRTFASVFPEAQLWALGGDLALVGTTRPASLDLLHRYYQASPYLQFEMEELGFGGVDQLAGGYLCPLQYALKDVPPGPLNTDDNPLLEYSAPLSMYSSDSYASNLAWVYSLRSFGKLPDTLAGQAGLRQSAALGSLAFASLARPLPLEATQAHPGWEELAAFYANPSALSPELHQAHLQWLSRYPDWSDARRWLAQTTLMGGTAEQLLDLMPPAEIPLTAQQDYYWLRLRALAEIKLQHWETALALYQRLSNLRKIADYDSAIALCQARLHHWPEAEAAARKALQSNPIDPRARLVMATLDLEQGRVEEALKEADRITRDCPFLQQAWLMQAQILAKQGQDSKTRQVIEQYLIFFPGDKEVRGLLQQL